MPLIHYAPSGQQRQRPACKRVKLLPWPTDRTTNIFTTWLGYIMKATSKDTKHGWSKFDSMTPELRRQAALDDPDAQPMSEEDFARMKRTPKVRVMRRALGLSQEEFSAKFHIPLGTLRDWEQGRREPDIAARAYLTVIGREREAVERAF
jgi:putative transcriptional regulator